MQTGTVTEACAAYLGEYLGKIRACVERLGPEQLWWRPAPGTNSVGNLLLHLRGNLTQWVLGGLAGEAAPRRRREEFTASGAGSGGPAELLDGLSETVARCQGVVRALFPEDLGRRIRVQGYDTDGLGIVLHVTEHTSYHTGQIVLLVKQLLGEASGIDFYPQHRGE